MREKESLLFCLIFLCFSTYSEAQTVIDTSRRVDWSRVGIPGDIPTRTTICASLNPGATAAEINNAIAACPSGQVVFLNPGIYNLSAGIDVRGVLECSNAGGSGPSPETCEGAPVTLPGAPNRLSFQWRLLP